MEIKLNPSKEMRGVVSYIIAGAGPGKNVFYESNVKDVVFKRNLASGTWKISIDGLDSNGKLAARGYCTVKIIDGKSIEAPVKIRRLRGYGKIIVNATLAQNKFPKIIKLDGELWQIGRRPIEIEFNSNKNTFSYNKYLYTGYYDLIIKIKKYKRTIGGAVKTIKIMDGGSSEISIDIVDVNKILFSIDSSPRFVSTNKVSIMRDRNFSVGEAINMHADYSIKGDVVISWYIDGEYVHNGNLFTVDKKLPHGVHRLDVSVFNLNSNRGASAASIIQVLKVNPHAPGYIYKSMSLEKFYKKSM